MRKRALEYYLSTITNHCISFKTPIETAIENEKIISAFLEPLEGVKIGLDNNGYLFQAECDDITANIIIDHLLETEGIFIPIDD